MSRRIAIILRGPPCAGKSEACKELERRFPGECSLVSLDRFWSPGEKRFLGECRYWDLRDNAAILLIELAYGEPHGEPFLGATKNPMEWLSILEAERRESFLFLLTASLPTLLSRILARGDLSEDVVRRDHARFQVGGVCSREAFAKRLPSGFSEEILDTENLGLQAVGDRIASAARLT